MFSQAAPSLEQPLLAFEFFWNKTAEVRRVPGENCLKTTKNSKFFLILAQNLLCSEEVDAKLFIFN